VVEGMRIMVPGDTIGAGDLPAAWRGDGAASGDGERALWEGDYASLRDARGAFEKSFIERKLAALEGNVSRTALALGLERSNLYRKMRAYGIAVERPGADGALDPGGADDPGGASGADPVHL